MRPSPVLPLLFLLLSQSFFITSGAIAEEADLPIRKIVLYSSGVGYFEHRATVEDEVQSELMFKQDQINDVLKSLVLEDQGGGTIGSVVYPSRDPIEKTLRSFGIDLSGQIGLSGLLEQIQGARVFVSVEGETIEGTVVSVDHRPKALSDEGEPTTVPVLNLFDGTSLKSIDLDEIRSVELGDNEREEISEALKVLSQARDQEKKPVTLEFRGEGPRDVRVGYLIETPVWKTSYRLIMPPSGSKEGKIQGWAIVENQTDNDWSDIELSLVSGRPVSFVMDLYEPLYVPRPTVEMELYESLRPKTYAGGMGGYAPRSGAWDSSGPQTSDRYYGEAGVEERAEVVEVKPRREKGADYVQEFAPPPAMAGSVGLAQAPPPMDPTQGIQSAASASALGELFEYAVPSVTLPRQRSAMLPIVTDPIRVDRLSIYNQETQAIHPMVGARLLNTTDKHLMQGPITVFDDGAYAGDAQIENLPPGQNRLLIYAIDLEVRVDIREDAGANEILSAVIDRGVLRSQRKSARQKSYLLKNEGDHSKVVLVEHPVRESWNLVDSPKPTESTPTHHRFEVETVPDATTSLTVKEEIVRSENLFLLDFDVDALLQFSQTTSISPRVREALTQAANLKRAQSETERTIGDRRNRVNLITTDQQRIRENIRSGISQQSEYYSRMVSKLSDQETELETLNTEITELEKTLELQRKQLAEYLTSLSID